MQLGSEAIGQVFELLKGAQSAHPEVQKASEATLKILETQPGFCSCLAVRHSPVPYLTMHAAQFFPTGFSPNRTRDALFISSLLEAERQP